MERGRFVIQISSDLIIDLATIDKRSWDKLKKTASILVKSNQVPDPGLAYIASFLIYIQEVEMMITDPTNDTMM